MTGVSVDTRIHRTEHSLGDVPPENISQEVHDEHARLTWRRSIQLHRRNINRHNLYARRANRDNEMIWEKAKKDPSLSKKKKSHREWRHAVIYDGNGEKRAKSFIRRNVSRLFSLLVSQALLC